MSFQINLFTNLAKMYSVMFVLYRVSTRVPVKEATHFVRLNLSRMLAQMCEACNPIW